MHEVMTSRIIYDADGMNYAASASEESKSCTK